MPLPQAHVHGAHSGPPQMSLVRPPSPVGQRVYGCRAPVPPTRAPQGHRGPLCGTRQDLRGRQTYEGEQTTDEKESGQSPRGSVDAHFVADRPKWQRGAGFSAGRRVEAAATRRSGERRGRGLRFKRRQRCSGRRGSPPGLHRRTSRSPAGSGGPVQTGSGRWCRPAAAPAGGRAAVASGAERPGEDPGPLWALPTPAPLPSLLTSAGMRPHF